MTSEELTDPDGRAWLAQYLWKELPKVSRRSH
jgi:hypothetical protein